MSVCMISGQPLGQYLQTNLWAPLGMNDTGFYIPPEKAARYAKPLPNDPLSGKLQSVAPVLTEKLEIECGGGCAASTVTDYLRFALMLMHGGQGGEARILGHEIAGQSFDKRSVTTHQHAQDSRVHALRSTRAEGHEPRQQCRSDPRRFRLRPRAGDQADAGRHADNGIGGLVLMARRQRYRLVGRSKGRPCGRLPLGGVGPVRWYYRKRSTHSCIRRSSTDRLDALARPAGVRSTVTSSWPRLRRADKSAAFIAA